MSKYNKTIYSCFIAYIAQSIINNFTPLLFITFQDQYEISLSKITLLVTINFGLQLLVDLFSAAFIDKIGYRRAILLAHILSAMGLISLSILPDLFADPYIGLLISVTIYAMGGGMLEVLISLIVEACPTSNKDQVMSILHSFYCWGSVFVILFSTIFFNIFGVQNWKFLVLIWALIPLLNSISFITAPIAPIIKEGEIGLTIKELFQEKAFWACTLIMLCAGACEQSILQWASTFAEKGLGVSKTVGDLCGPMMFVFLMGISRLIYGKYGHKINLDKFMLFSGILCIISYLMISLAPFPILGLLGCGLCGLSVGILWPGTYSTAAMSIKGGGTALFALLALAGDIGCSSGPTFVGLISGVFNGSLRIGILVAIIFPALLIIGILTKKRVGKEV